MTRRRFVTLDVFTQAPLAGNPLAVVLDADGLEGAAMQAIAREFNLSETVFVLPPSEARHRARLRIFTPTRELPFAGHPTVGTAVLLALEDARSGVADAIAFGLEEEAGIVPCVVEAGQGWGRARFKAPVLPSWLGEGPETEDLAAMLGLPAEAIGFARHLPSRHSAGVPFLFVPVSSCERLDAIALDLAKLPEDEALYVYAADPEGLGHRYRARMFAPHLGVREDPATGSAAAAFAGVMMQFESLGDGEHDATIRQGVAMGRPSEIAMQLTVRAGSLDSVEIGGDAVVVSEGVLLV